MIRIFLAITLMISTFAMWGCLNNVANGPKNSNAEVVVYRQPPAPKVEVQPARPGPEYAWQSGHWIWEEGRFIWKDGQWTKRPRTGALWANGHWVQKGLAWAWVPGHWQ